MPLPRLRHLASALLVAALAGSAAAPASALPRIKEVSTHISGAGLADMAQATDGTVWITAETKGSLLALQPDGQVIERPIGGTGTIPRPRHLAGASDGALWATDPTDRSLLRVARDAQATRFTAGLAAGTVPGEIVRGGEGDLWFATGAPRIGRATNAGTITELPTTGTPRRVARAAAGGVWFTTGGATIGRVDAEGSLSSRAAPAPATDLVEGPGDALWLSTAEGIVRLDGSGTPTTFRDGLPAGAVAADLAAGADGNVWFTVAGQAIVGRITPEGAITTFRTENTKLAGGGGVVPQALVAGGGGDLHYYGTADDGLIADVVGSVSTAGVPSGRGLPAEDVGVDTATLVAEVQPEGGPTSVRFEYGASPSLGLATPEVPIGSGLTAHTARATLTKLDPKRIYHYRIVATNRMGEWRSGPLTFTTQNIELPTAPVFPGVPNLPGPAPIAPGGPPVAATSALTVGMSAARIARTGIVKVKLVCAGSAPCSATLAVTAKVATGRKAKKAGSVVIATKAVKLAPGATSLVGLRVSAAGQSAIRRAGRKGLPTLAVLTTGAEKRRTRLTLKR